MFSNTTKFIANKAAVTITNFVTERGYDMPIVTRTFVHSDLIIELECDFYGDIVITADNDTMTIKGNGRLQSIHSTDLFKDSGEVETDHFALGILAWTAAIKFMNEFED